MAIEIRTIRDEESRELLRLDAILFGYAESDEALPDILEVSRILCAFDDDRMVGSSAVLSLDLTVPGGEQVRMAGITWVGVLTTHRRRGIMRELMTEQLARLEGSEESVAGLGASQSLLYDRFGFGPASRNARVEIETAHAAFREPCHDVGGLEQLDIDSAMAVLPALHARVRLRRNGMISRLPQGHRRSYRDAAKEVDEAGPIRFVVHRDAGGEIDGIVTYRFRLHFDANGLFDGDIRVVELLAPSEAAEAALWRHCLDHDLARRVTAAGRPVDAAVVDRLADPRRWTQRITDDLHLRPIDVPALLAARRYSREDVLTFEVRDPLFEWGSGRFRLEGGLHGASCARVDDDPDIVLGPADLGAIYLGDVPVERLWRGGRVEERTEGAVRRATAMFTWSPAPWLSYMF